MQQHPNIAYVRVEDEDEKRIIAVSSGKPEIPDAVVSKWQKIVDLTAKIMDVPTGLLTRFTDEVLEVFIASNTKGNPYNRFDTDSLGIGMFCETVAGKKQQMTVQNTEDTEYWRTNPHAGLGMHSYVGVPIEWDDGELFGTFCMLNDKANMITDEFKQLLVEFKAIIETDLKNILINKELEDRLSASELYTREVHHRIKNHFNLLISLINMQSREINKDIGSVLSDLEHRVRAISTVHEKLQSQDQSGKIELSEYIEQLCQMSLSSMNIGITPSLELDLEKLLISLDKTVPLGLIISELLSNSQKYAFSDSQGNKEEKIAQVKISIKKKQKDGDRDFLNILYCDNGKGYSSRLNLEHAETLGLTLISVLTKQIGGEMHLENKNGACYSTEIPL